MKPNIKKRVKEICKEFDSRVKVVGVATAGFELAVSLAEEEATQHAKYADGDEIARLRELLFVYVLCGACGHTYKYSRADDPKGVKGHAGHLVAYPDCPSSPR